ncbi:MAG: endopeptidase La [candidate division KSB1 bacterium]|nr:endopeptidase La [candidate division KSB1 bacterium]
MRDEDLEQYASDEEVRGREIPTEVPILPLRDTVIYPYMVTPLVVARPKSVQLIQDVVVGNRILGLVAQRKAEIEDPSPEQIYRYGTVASILKMLKFPDGSLRVLVQGLRRIQLVKITQTDPYFRALIRPLEDIVEPSTELEALANTVSSLFQRVVNMSPHLPDELAVAAMNTPDPSRLADLVASNITLPTEEKQALLEELNVKLRLERLVVHLSRIIEVLEMSSKIQDQVQSELSKSQREYFLREQLKAIQKELGMEDERTAEIRELREKIEQARMPEEAEKEALRELDRLAKMPPGAAEYTVARTYLDWLVSLPWSVSTEDNLDIERAQRILDEDHYDLKRVKERILEFLAVRKLKQDQKGPILCFVGPPGVGKTSLGRSIARALGRKFVRISLGGVRDEAEIRGHRRTYVGALPGRIIRGLRTAGSNNPVFMLDEVDKLGADFRGDPSSALLEVLDPEQNNSFVDHYLDVKFDLSRVMFICTANVLDTVPPPLRDRMEVLELPGYTEEEKLMIAFKYLIPRQLKEHGLRRDNLRFEKRAVRRIIREYTREAGLRNLEREIANICRKVAKKVALEGPVREVITAAKVPEYLGPPKYFSEVAERTSEPGVATGLAWTPSGGDILFVECTRMPGSKQLILTGQLGEVMRESAQAALSWVRSRAQKLGIEENFMEKSDIHIHVPAGAIPKDGPSAGVTIVTALVSLLTGKPVRHDLAMTGEITLRGKVLPVGGIKEKVLAAHRAGIRTVILPERNRKDLEEIPKGVLDELEFHFVENLDQVLRIAFAKTGAAKKRKRSTRLQKEGTPVNP